VEDGLVYLRPEEALASRGFQVVVFRHPHLVKEFVEAMADYQLERWRTLVSTFARLECADLKRRCFEKSRHFGTVQAQHFSEALEDPKQ
jgi:hypothetical protein